MAESAQIQKVGTHHMAILDYIMANPTERKGDIAKKFGVTQSWLSIIINSHAFQDMLKERQNEFFGAVVVPLREKAMAVADMALEQLAEKIPVMSGPQALDTADKLLNRLGYAPNTQANGQKPPGQATAVQNNFFVGHDVLTGARENFGRATAKAPLEGEYEEIVEAGGDTTPSA